MSNRFAMALRASLENDATDAAALDADEPVVTTDEVDVVEVAPVAETAEEVTVLSNDVADETVIDTTETMEEAVEAQDEAESAVDETEAQTNELEEAAAGLESIYDELVEIRKSGRTDRTTLRMANVAIESFTDRLGASGQVSVSVESFNVQASMESVKETLLRWWDAIKKMAARLWAKIVAFFQRLFTATGRLQARGERLSKLKLSGTAKSATISAKDIAERIALNGNIELDAQKGLYALRTLIVKCSLWARKAEGVTVAAAEHAKKLLENPEAVSEDGVDNLAKTMGLPEGFSFDGPTGKASTPLLPGNVRFTCTPATSSDSGGDAKITIFRFVRKEVDAAAAAASAKLDTVDTMSADKVIATGKAVGDLVKSAVDAKKYLDSQRKRVQQSVAKYDALINRIAGQDDPKSLKVKIRLKKEIMKAKHYESFPFQLCIKIIAHAVSVAGAYVQLAERSAVQYAKAAKSSNEAYSEEGFSGAFAGAVLALFAAPFTFGLSTIAGAVAGHKLQQYVANRKKQQELAKKRGHEKEMAELRNEQLRLEKEIMSEAKAADAKKKA